MTEAERWDYGGHHRDHDMRGEIVAGTGIVKVHDLFEPLPAFMRSADCVFVDPPWNAGLFKGFYTKAGLSRAVSFDDFVRRMFECIDEIAPKALFIEIGRQHVDDFERRMRTRYKDVFVYQGTYYHKAANAAFLVQGVMDPAVRGLRDAPPGLDEEDAIAFICQRVPFHCIGDLCMGRGFVGWYANKAGRRFVGTELNEKRLAVLVARIAQNKLKVGGAA